MTVGHKKNIMSDVNITPLIDVLLVLIIIFMVITPLTPRGLDALVPQPGKIEPPARPDSANAIVVSIDSTRQITINRQPTDLQSLAGRLENIFKTRNERVLFVQADSTLPFDEVAHVIDVARGAGVDKIGLMTKELNQS